MTLSSTLLAAAGWALAAPEPGVPLALALERAARLSDVSYELEFSVPASTAVPVTGSALVRFELSGDGPLAFDFRRPAGSTLTVHSDGKPLPFEEANEHVIVRLPRGRNVVGFTFAAGDGPLNRSADFLYTLLVPARAREVFPCFDQPDVKARFSLTLRLPPGWTGVSNGAETAVEPDVLRFAATPPMSTYLFAFAAGVFKVDSDKRGGRTLRLFHRETDALKFERNRAELYDLAASSLEWMERYTGIEYPWAKFDSVLLPAFQYGGMEHPGAVFYNAERQLLDADATQDQRLKRASTIAHEAAHMWFGDLVTMRWFDDVWLKEVFANFMAAKMVEPRFPGLDHRLRFLMTHQPHAYEVDATSGTHPILQPLDNLSNAGLLYGDIVYFKSPVVMRQLELQLGEETMRQGLADYLRAFRFGNASWAELLAVLERRARRPLGDFGRAWVQEAGRPALSVEASGGRLAVRQSDPAGRGRVWPQKLEPYAFPPGRRPRFAIADGGGLGYGEMLLDESSREWFIRRSSAIPSAAARGAGWLALWDDVVAGRLSGRRYLLAVRRALPNERDELLIQRLISTAAEAVWRYVPEEHRRWEAQNLERLFEALLPMPWSASSRKAYLRGLMSVSITDEGLARLRRLWEGRRDPGLRPPLELSEDDRAELALELALRSPDGSAILETQLASMKNPDRRARFAFLARAASADPAAREAFFRELLTLPGRRREAWVAGSRRYGSWTGDALHLLNHPLRAKQSLSLLLPALETLEEIQRTGDIFFPAGWVSAALSGHRSPEAAAVIKDFLSSRPGYPAPLVRLILQELHYVEAAVRQSGPTGPASSSP